MPSNKIKKPDLTQLITGFVGSVCWYCLSMLPGRLRWFSGCVIGSAMRQLSGHRRNVAKNNIELCFPELGDRQRSQLLRRSFMNAGAGTLSWGFALFASRERILNEVRWSGVEQLEELINAKQSIILVHPHFTTPMIAFRALTERFPVITIYKRPRNPVFDYGYKCAMENLGSPYRWLNRLYRHRSANTGAMIHNTSSMRPIYRALEAAVPFFYLPDQSAGGLRRRRVFAPFFGVSTSSYSAISKFAGFRNSRIMLCYCEQLPLGRGYEMHLKPLPEDFITGDSLEDVTRLNLEIENVVRQLPEQYFWMHQRFKHRN